MKFLKLLKKELKELITFSTLIGLVVALLMFLLVGNFMKDINSEMSESQGQIIVCDQDNSKLSKDVLGALKQGGFEVKEIQGSDDFDLMDKAKENGQSSFIIIESGFEKNFSAGKKADVRVVNKIETFAMSSTITSSFSSAAVEVINQMLSTTILSTTDLNKDVEFAKSPVNVVDTTISKGNSENVNASILSGFAMQQSMFVPIIVFLLITFATQMTISTIANEKGDKTLETLLSAPVSRLSVLMSKMCAAGILSLLMAGVFMFGFSRYMGSMTGMGGDMGAQMGDVSSALASLGLKLGVTDYLLLGLQLFLTILIALGFSTILGALSKDLKSAQGLVSIIMVMAMIPYFLTIFSDINTMPTIARVLLSIIPFTHTFTATSNLIFGNYTMFFIGVVYQVVALIIVLGFAVKIFSSDLIFTMTLDLSKKRTSKSKKAAIEE